MNKFERNYRMEEINSLYGNNRLNNKDSTFRIEIESEYDCYNELHQHLAEAKKLNVDTDISRILEGGIFVHPDFDNYYVKNQIDFFSAIYEACDKAEYSPERIILWWGNANVKELYQQWCDINKPTKLFKGVYYFPVWLFMLYANIDNTSDYFDIDPAVKRTKLFTFFVGFEREHRIKAINFLYENDLLDSCEWTWANSETHGLPEELHPQIPKSAEGHAHYTEKSTTENPGKEFFMLYENNYFDLITETYYSNDYHQYEAYNKWNGIFFSEKIWRSIMNKRPFLLIGNKNALRELHNLGFKTFPTMFDESYDSIGDEERIYHVLDQLKGLTVDEVHNNVYSKEVSEAVEHNYAQIKKILFSQDNATVRFAELWTAEQNFCVVDTLPII
jgi:hypothetical protein